MKEYQSIVKHYERCFEKHGDSHLGADWPNREDVSTRFHVMLDGIREKGEEVSILDFGCGSARLYDYILDKKDIYSLIEYSGSDLSEKFVDFSRSKYPNNKFYCFDILTTDISKLPIFDYVVMNGVFTEKRELTFDEMWDSFKRMITAVFQLTKKGIAFNVMSKSVDWERDDLFHLSTDLLIDFITKELSRDFVIRNDYGLYEYTVYVYKDKK